MVTSFPSVLQVLPECFRTPIDKTHTLAKKSSEDRESVSALMFQPDKSAAPAVEMRALLRVVREWRTRVPVSFPGVFNNH